MPSTITDTHTILVLGATGTVGTVLVQRLVDAGHVVKAATRDPSGYQGPGAGTALDLTDASTWTAALDGVDRLFVLAPPGHANQYELLRPFLDAALETGRIERVVTMTAQGVDFSDEIPFRKLELFIEAKETAFIHLRPSWFAQNFHTFWGHGVREHDTVALPAADAKVAFLDTRDLAEAAAMALTRDDIEVNRAYVLTGPVALTHAEAAEVLAEVTGRSIRYTSISDEAFRQQLAPSGLPSDYIELLVELFGIVRMGVAAQVTADVRVLTGRDPRPLVDYARDHRSALG